MGTVHGGILCDLADAAMGTAYASQLGDRRELRDAGAEDQLPAAVLDGPARRRGARRVSGGRTVGMVEADVRDENGRLIARASSTCMTLRGDAAAGR